VGITVSNNIDMAVGRALDAHNRMQADRVRALYNRHRAVFAEFLVAEHLPGAVVELDPSCPWDLRWVANGEAIRVQVKCSGEFLPHYPDKPNTKVSWDISTPKTAWDSEHLMSVPSTTHSCDVWVFCRHVGNDLEAGWTFAAIATNQLPAGKTLRMKNFPTRWGARLSPGSDLERQARFALANVSDRHTTDEAIAALAQSLDDTTRAELQQIAEVVRAARTTDGARNHAIEELLRCVYTLGLIIPFDWPTWSASRDAAVDTLGQVDAIRLLTTIVRSDRFNEGTLSRALEDGTITQLLTAIIDGR
jgi:hypothetical protein